MKVRIGTRKSPLALYQANFVAKKLREIHLEPEIIGIESKGDQILDKPLYEIGVVGIFTRSLDLALLAGEIDIAVHSLKDVPTQLPKGIEISAYMKRGNAADLLIYKLNSNFENTHKIATGSLRRKAFWLQKYPLANFVDLRGNVQTRIKKLAENKDWDAAIFASAGIERSQLLDVISNHNLQTKELDWMLPATSQGIMAIASLYEKKELKERLREINHPETEKIADFERSFLRKLEGGCSMPIGIKTKYLENKNYQITAAVLSLDGKRNANIERNLEFENPKEQGISFAAELIGRGGKSIVTEYQSI